MTLGLRADILIIGAGFIAHHLQQKAFALGLRAVTASRRWPAHATRRSWIQLDACDESALACVIDQCQPKSVILVHGPSDITWCEDHLEECYAIHTRVAANVIEHTSAKTHLIFISSDNVFAGTVKSYGESDAPEPQNAYGCAKLAAERILQDAAQDTTILRTSLVYGLNEVARGWTNFFSLIQGAVATGQPVQVPVDRWNTPIWAEDVARIVMEVLIQNCTGVIHLAGPVSITRYDWAHHIATAMDGDTDLIRGVPATSTRFACRPKYSCLHHERADDQAALIMRNRVSPHDAATILEGQKEMRSLSHG
ncbi:MAG: sugar nucleotide-binding protein [Pseudomonadota bacterium]